LNELVIPAFAAKYPNGYSTFNLKSPIIHQEDSVVHMIFSQADPEKGIFPVDSAFFEIETDRCGLRVTEAHEFGR
jgi:hypothetical protein